MRVRHTLQLEQSMVNHQFVLEAKAGALTVARQCYDNELLVQVRCVCDKAGGKGWV